MKKIITGTMLTLEKMSKLSKILSISRHWDDGETKHWWNKVLERS